MDKLKELSGNKKVGAEFLGSLLVVFVVCSVFSAGKVDTALTVFGPTAIACVYMAMSYTLRNVSGGILNPAVTFALILQGATERGEGLKMMIAQAAGGAVAGFATLFLYGWDSEASPIHPESGLFLLGAPIVEALYTCLLCFVYMNVNMPKADGKGQYYGLAVGFVLIAGGVGGKYVSGGAYNPAVSLGVNFMGANWKVIILPIYVAAQGAGAFLAVVLFNVVRKDQLTMKEDNELTKGFLTKAVQSVNLDPEDSCEFIGTLFLSLTISLNQIAQNQSDCSNCSAGKVWSSAACLISLIYAMSDISGGLFNPAVTVAYAVRFWGTDEGLDDDGKCRQIKEAKRICDWKKSSKETLKYFIFQLLGGAAGTGLTILVWLAKAGDTGVWPVAGIAPGKPPGSEPYSNLQATFAEFYGTFLICFAMLVVMLSKKDPNPEFGPFVVGGCVIAAGYAFGPLSGGFFNPAIVAGDAVGSKLQFIYTLPPVLYVAGQLFGGILAGVVFRFTHSDEIGGTPPLKETLLSGKEQNLLPVLP
jgi:aquaporin Z